MATPRRGVGIQVRDSEDQVGRAVGSPVGKAGNGESANSNTALKLADLESASEESPTSSEVPEDPVYLYLREIGQVPLLTAEEEQMLGRAIQARRRARERLQRGTPTEAARGELLMLMEEGDQARRLLVRANLRLVVSVARKFLGRGLSLSDLIQEGNLGLMRAAQKFEPRKGYRFSTYATWWIRQAITRSIADHGRSIRIPAHMVDSISKLLRAQRELAQNGNHTPSLEELACQLGLLSPEDLKVIQGSRKGPMALERPLRNKHRRAVVKVRRILQASQEPVSLELNVGGEDDAALGDFIEDKTLQAPLDLASLEGLREQMDNALDELDPKERRVLEMRFGLVDGQPRTLEQVGDAFGVTRERIRQIESKALRKLRHPQHWRKLKDYL